MWFNALGFEEFLKLCTMTLEALKTNLRAPSDTIPFAGELQRWIFDEENTLIHNT